MSLYQKHRPDSLEDVVGNKSTIVTLSNVIKEKQKMPHAFLLLGPTGCGKTTIARIIANNLNCKKGNLIEIDTAQFNGIDTVREIRKNSQYTPLGGGDRVFIIDEVHRMTTDAQNAFLKILEDTPPHIYFILCTTNEGSLLPTIKGRCSTYTMSLLKDAEMEMLLEGVIEKENAKVDQEVIEVIVNSAAGHPRNALTILEQVIAAPPKQQKKLAAKVVEEEVQIKELSKILIKPNRTWKEVSFVLRGLKGQSEETIRRAVLGYMSGILLNTYNKEAAIVMECFVDPFYNSGFPGLVYACLQVVNGEN